MMVQDKKTGQWYDPAVKFRELLAKPEIIAVFKRLAVR